MNFSRVIGKIDPQLVKQAENKLSQVFLELGLRQDNTHAGSGMGGDSLIFTLMHPIEKVCTVSMPTAATDGKRFYWNPNFVVKMSKIGLRLVCCHEAWHALYMHPQRRGSRLPKLWNIAVDFIVNNTCMEDLKTRKFDPKDTFKKNLGNYMTLDQYAQLLKDPFSPIPGCDFDITNSKQICKLPNPDEDRELTPEEMEELERREKVESFFYADPDIPEEMRRPEKIYDMLYALLPKCPKCGKIGIYKRPDKNKKKDQGDKKKGKGKNKQDQDDQNDQNDQDDQHKHGTSPQCCCGDEGDGDGKCPNCDDGVDIFGFGSTLDEHIDTTEKQDKLAKRIADAIEAAKKLAGSIPSALEDELGILTAPKVSWKDIVRTRLLKYRSGNGRNDWTRFKTRPMFCGVMTPKRRNYIATFGCLLDTSGSMSNEDMAFGVSQLQSLDERNEGTIVFADAEIYWDNAVKIKKCNTEELKKLKPVGRGGTMFGEFFDQYEKKIGDCDFLIVITDGYLSDGDVACMRNPLVEVIWLLTANSSFTPPFGKVYNLID